MGEEQAPQQEPKQEPKEPGKALAEQVLFMLSEVQKRKEEEPPKTPITKEKYILGLCEQIAFYENQALQCHVKVVELRGYLSQIETLEDLKMVVHYFDEGDHLSYEVKAKPEIGFARPDDTSTWNEEQIKKRRKKK